MHNRYKQLSQAYTPGRLLKLLIACCISAASQAAHALDTRTCFAQAQTYYETLYCEINAQAPGVTLPDFWDFKKNNEVMQALLIKKPARKIFIDVARPVAATVKSRSAPALAIPPANSSAAIQSSTETPSQISNRQHDCVLSNRQLRCANLRYIALGNRANQELDASVWRDDFKLELPRFIGDYQNERQVLDYVTESYTQYLQYMIAIGLAGETFSFTKFAFFFDDHHAKGVDFSARFAKMFHFLKQDKKNIAVNTALKLPASIDSRYCSAFANLLACATERSNYLFRRSDNI